MTHSSSRSSLITTLKRFVSFANVTNIGFFALIFAIVCGVASFMILTGMTQIVPTHNVVLTALLANAFAAFFLLLLIVWRLAQLFILRRRQAAGARLHLQIVGIFALIAAVPAVLIAVIAGLTLDQGLDRWFSERTRTLIERSLSVAQIYLNEQGKALREQTIFLANEVNKTQPLHEVNPEQMTSFLMSFAQQGQLSGVYILAREDQHILVEAEPQGDRDLILPPREIFDRLAAGDVVLIAPGDTDVIGAVARVPQFYDGFLFVIKRIDPIVTNYIRQTEVTAREFQSLAQRRVGIQLAFALMYTTITLIVLLSAVWFGLHFATRIVAPIRRLITAANQVAGGNYYVSVPVEKRQGDFQSLGMSFNTMTSELRVQRSELMSANADIDQRRRQTEAILEGVTAGVIGVGGHGVIRFMNSSARRLLYGSDFVAEEGESKNTPLLLGDISRDLMDLYQDLFHNNLRHLQTDILFLDPKGLERRLSVRLVQDDQVHDDVNVVITLDDITNLVHAQRMSAWADVARRIAHEIKNPLTPIQLSAERLKRRYGRHINDDDRLVFDQCIETIVRQVGDIGAMVDEFSAFARMPKPTLVFSDVRETARQVVFLMQVGHPELEISLVAEDRPYLIAHDHRQISQMLTNLIKNSSEAIEENRKNSESMQIELKLSETIDRVVIDVFDTGPGFPKQERDKLLEPYMTTRDKGTGLGLAIVRRIVDEHGGDIFLKDAVDTHVRFRGGHVQIIFYKDKMVPHGGLKTLQHSGGKEDSGVNS